jgi:hypothetical protein
MDYEGALTTYMYMQKLVYLFLMELHSRYLGFVYTTLISRGRDRMVVGFTITCAISAYHH